MHRTFRHLNLIFLLVFFNHGVSYSYQLEMECDDQNNVISQGLADSSLDAHLQARIANGSKSIDVLNVVPDECSFHDVELPDNRYGGISFESAENSRARAWSTRVENPNTYFDEKKVNEIVKLAIKNNLDPYAALAVAIIEDPPYVNSKKGRMGSTITQATVAQAFGCHVEVSGRRKILVADKIEQQMDLTSSNHSHVTKKDICVSSNIKNGDATLLIEDQNKERGHQCCVHAQLESSSLNGSPSKQRSEVTSQVSSYLFMRLLGEQIKKSLNQVPQNMTDSAATAWILQGYNGRGIMPKGAANKCLSQVDMNKHPVYGATVGDVMMNMLMLSPELSDMISKAKQDCEVPVKSLFCTTQGAGKHQIDSQSFADLEKNYLSHGSLEQEDHRRLKACSAGKPPITFQPWQAEDAQTFFGN